MNTLLHIRTCDLNGLVDDALDMIFNYSDYLMREGKLAELDNFIKDIRVANYSVDVLIGFLTATLPCKKSLKNRPELYRQIEKYFKELNFNDETLLVGLE